MTDALILSSSCLALKLSETAFWTTLKMSVDTASAYYFLLDAVDGHGIAGLF